jgi:hypothetical protein
MLSMTRSCCGAGPSTTETAASTAAAVSAAARRRARARWRALAPLDGLPRLALQDDADGMVDRVALPSPSGPEPDRGQPDGQRVGPLHRPGRGAPTSSRTGAASSTPHGSVTTRASPPCAAIQASAVATASPPPSAASTRRRRTRPVVGSGQDDQLDRRAADQLGQVGRPLAAQHREGLVDLEGVADGAPERRVHARQLADHAPARPGSHAVHERGQPRPRRRAGRRRLPDLDASTIAPAPAASFFDITDVAISPGSGTVAVASRSA